MTDFRISTESAPTYAVAKHRAALDDDQIIALALGIVRNRLRTFSYSFASPESVTSYLTIELANLESERFDVLFLNNQNRLIEHVPMFYGTIDGASVYPREVVKKALELNAAAVILAHNHPSGIQSPSQADKNITQKIKDAMALMEIRTLDHIIVAGGSTYSFAEHGLI
jgi:DNA repair protein RadC